MKHYKMYLTIPFGEQAIITVNDDGSTTSFLANYFSDEEQTFKNLILADEADLEDNNGNMLSPEEAKIYVLTLP